MTHPDAPAGGAAPVTARILDTAVARGEQTAISSFGRSWTYAQLTARAGRMTGALARLDVGPDKRLGLLLPPVPTAAMACAWARRWCPAIRWRAARRWPTGCPGSLRACCCRST